ncbi:hypothetical protein WJX73_000310 [Symbiochloris irregularis]|uniref:Protein-tyrosine-phosphatase n=1 Tax=Symbiochloris irregularis TaxID=706552 RepID=A0AAW1NTD2_9CHLO
MPPHVYRGPSTSGVEPATHLTTLPPKKKRYEKGAKKVNELRNALKRAKKAAKSSFLNSKRFTICAKEKQSTAGQVPSSEAQTTNSASEASHAVEHSNTATCALTHRSILTPSGSTIPASLPTASAPTLEEEKGHNALDSWEDMDADTDSFEDLPFEDGNRSFAGTLSDLNRPHGVTGVQSHQQVHDEQFTPYQLSPRISGNNTRRLTITSRGGKRSTMEEAPATDRDRGMPRAAAEEDQPCGLLPATKRVGAPHTWKPLLPSSHLPRFGATSTAIIEVGEPSLHTPPRRQGAAAPPDDHCTTGMQFHNKESPARAAIPSQEGFAHAVPKLLIPAHRPPLALALQHSSFTSNCHSLDTSRIGLRGTRHDEVVTDLASSSHGFKSDVTQANVKDLPPLNGRMSLPGAQAQNLLPLSLRHMFTNRFGNALTYHTLCLNDVGQEDISSIFYHVFDIIQEVERQGGRVMVHCSQGVSRSATLAIGYYMWRTGAGFVTATKALQIKRTIINPNAGFLGQLATLQKNMKQGCQETRLWNVVPHSQTAAKMYIWQGQEAVASLVTGAWTGAGQLQRYEGASSAVQVVQEGDESEDFQIALQAYIETCSPGVKHNGLCAWLGEQYQVHAEMMATPPGYTSVALPGQLDRGGPRQPPSGLQLHQCPSAASMPVEVVGMPDLTIEYSDAEILKDAAKHPAKSTENIMVDSAQDADISTATGSTSSRLSSASSYTLVVDDELGDVLVRKGEDVAMALRYLRPFVKPTATVQPSTSPVSKEPKGWTTDAWVDESEPSSGMDCAPSALWGADDESAASID